MLKIADLSSLGPNISAHRFFPDIRFEAVNSKYSLVSHIFEWGIFNDALRHHKKNVVLLPTLVL